MLLVRSILFSVKLTDCTKKPKQNKATSCSMLQRKIVLQKNVMTCSFNAYFLGEEGYFWSPSPTPHLHPELHLSRSVGASCLPTGCVRTSTDKNVNREAAGPRLRKQLLVISNNWKIKIGLLPSRFVLEHLFSV